MFDLQLACYSTKLDGISAYLIREYFWTQTKLNHLERMLNLGYLWGIPKFLMKHNNDDSKKLNLSNCRMNDLLKWSLIVKIAQ